MGSLARQKQKILPYNEWSLYLRHHNKILIISLKHQPSTGPLSFKINVCGETLLSDFFFLFLQIEQISPSVKWSVKWPLLYMTSDKALNYTHRAFSTALALSKHRLSVSYLKLTK